MDTILRTLLSEKADLSADKGSTRYFWVAPDATVADAAQSMDEHGIGCMLIIDNGRFAGLINERDVMRGLVRHGAALAQQPVRTLISGKPFTVPPSLTVEQAMLLCTERRARHLPVEESGELLGLLSIGDLVRSLVQDNERTIEDLMHYIHGR
ncbi:MAG TPA: CBS domain-containing protein [Arenimonas sp.]|nr:CBS domain-containing protein [Arenimonas sp.]